MSAQVSGVFLKLLMHLNLKNGHKSATSKCRQKYKSWVQLLSDFDVFSIKPFHKFKFWSRKSKTSKGNSLEIDPYSYQGFCHRAVRPTAEWRLVSVGHAVVPVKRRLVVAGVDVVAATAVVVIVGPPNDVFQNYFLDRCGCFKATLNDRDKIKYYDWMLDETLQ